MTAIYLEQDGDRYTVSPRGTPPAAWKCARPSPLCLHPGRVLHNTDLTVLLNDWNRRRADRVRRH
jgi:hypothetical protein